MQYGDEYGELYGEAVADIETHTEDAKNRLIYALTNATEFHKLLAIFTDRVQMVEHATRGVSPDLLFRIATAYGQQLDQIGSLLGLKRERWDDDLYRVYLRTMSLLILPDRRTQAVLIAVIMSLLDGAPGGGVIYSEARPKTYFIEVTGTTIATLISWIRFIDRCRPITYNVFTKFIPEDPFVYDDSTATVAVTGEGFSDSSDTIDVGGKLASLIPITP